jgi:two-component system, chemotaxis family, chemotaxis protein CheY
MCKTIMVVDDSRNLRQVIGFAARNSGYKVVEAEDGQDALTKLRDGHVDLILTDLDMPRLGGLGLAQGVRKDPSYRSIPVIVVASDSQRSRMEEGRRAGANGWIVKPFTPAELMVLVRKALEEYEHHSDSIERWVDGETA